MTLTKEEIVSDISSRMVGGMIDRVLEVGYLELFCRYSDSQEALYSRNWSDGKEELKVRVEQDFVALTFTHHCVLKQSFSIVCELDTHFRVIKTTITVTSGDLNDVVSKFHELITKVVASVDTHGNPRR